MTDPPDRRFEARPFWRAIQVALAALLGSAVIFLMLTRTQVGRNGIRNQLEKAINQRIEGTLSIGQLTGTLIDDFVATDLRLRDPSGRIVATVDSIVAEPRWANLLATELSMQTLTVVRPHLNLHRDSSGTWNLRKALRRKEPSDSTQFLDVTFANLEIQSGRLTTTRSGRAPRPVRRNWLFDYTRTEIRGISAEASIRWTESHGFLELRNASFALPKSRIQVSSLQGLVHQNSKGWALENFDLSLDTTRIRADGFFRVASSRAQGNAFDLQLARSRINHNELRRLFPRLPLAGVVTVRGQMSGTSERLDLEGVTVTHNASFATLTGTLSGGASSSTVDLTLTDSRLAPGDVREVWPNLPPLPDSTIGSVELQGTLQGTLSRRPHSPNRFDLESKIAARSSHGAVQGSLSVERSRTASIQYSSSFKVDSLNLAPLTGTSFLTSRLNGRIELHATGSGTKLRSGEADLTLSSSRIRTHRFSAVDGQVWVESGRARGSMTFLQETGGTLHIEGYADSLGLRSKYTATVSASDFDLASQEGPLPSTRLNAQLGLRGAGTKWRSLTGTAVLNVDSSRVQRGDSTVVLPPHSATLHLAKRTQDRPRLKVTGSLASLTIDGTSLGPPLWSSSQLWSTALREAVQRELDKPAPSQDFFPIPSLFPPPTASNRASLRAKSRKLLQQPEISDPIHVEAQLQVDRSDILHKWWPALPNTSESLTANAALTISADSLHVSGGFSAAGLRLGTKKAKDLALHYDISGHLRAPLVETLRAKVDLSAQEIDVGGPPFLGAAASLRYSARKGSLRVWADSMGIFGSLQVKSTLNVTPDQNELRIRQASVEVRGKEWTNPSPASIFAYSNSIVVTPFILKRPHPQTPKSQRLRIDGRVSARPSDTLSVTAENIYLPPFSRALGSPNLIGGELTGGIHLRSGFSRPHLGGNLSVHRLSYDRRVLGNARLTASYSPDSPDLRLDAALVSKTRNADSLAGPEMVPNGARTVEPNNLSLSGRIRLPKHLRLASARRPSQTPSGAPLDLSVEVTRADLFFFRYIFEERVANVRGYTRGTIHIGGRFRNPIFDADLAIENGHVNLPLFGLQYEVEGSVTVDRKGIHVSEARIRDEEGSALVRGSILFNEYEYFSFDLSATLNEITVIDVSQAEDLPFYGHIRASGPLILTGPLPDATLRSNSARTTPESELFIPVSGETVESAPGFIVFADSTGKIPDLQKLTRRENILADRPEGEPTFVQGLNLDLNVTAPEGSTVNLVFDPIVGDVVTVVGSGRIQLQRKEGNFQVFGTFNATSGNYLFTAGEVFVREFSITGGSITWDGNPIDAQLNLDAAYRTRASPAGLPGYENYQGRIPVKVQLDITGRVSTPQVDLNLSLIRNNQNRFIGAETLDAILNQPGRRTEYATSVLLTNTFLLTTESLLQEGNSQTEGPNNRLTAAGNQLAFNSVSQLVSSQLNRYLGAALPNVDLNFGVQGEDPEDLDLVYGVALRLLNEQLVIRGQGVYTGDQPEARQVQGPQGEFVVEMRLSSSVSVQVFYRRRGDELTRNRVLTSSRGAGLSYQTQFSTWMDLLTRLFGWLLSPDSSSEDDETNPEAVAQRPTAPADTSRASESPQNPQLHPYY